MTIPDVPQGPSGRALLRQLLAERNQESERAAEIDDRIRRAFERTTSNGYESAMGCFAALRLDPVERAGLRLKILAAWRATADAAAIL